MGVLDQDRNLALVPFLGIVMHEKYVVNFEKRAGYAEGLSAVLNLLNTFEDKTISKKELYDKIMDMRPPGYMMVIEDDRN